MRIPHQFTLALLIAGLGLNESGCLLHETGIVLISPQDERVFQHENEAQPWISLLLRNRGGDFTMGVDVPVWGGNLNRSEILSHRPVQIRISLAMKSVPTTSIIRFDQKKVYVLLGGKPVYPSKLTAFAIERPQPPEHVYPHSRIVIEPGKPLDCRFESRQLRYRLSFEFDVDYRELEEGTLHIEGVSVGGEDVTVLPIKAQYGVWFQSTSPI